jgi:phage terminase large subunit-like protein
MSKILETLTKSLVDTYTNKKDYQEQQELIKAIEVIAKFQKYNKFESMFRDDGEFRRELYKKHMEFINAGGKYRERLFMAGNRVGKELPYSAKVLTKTGWKTFGDLTLEDTVLTPKGKSTSLAYITEQGVKDIYKLTFDDGSVAECGLEHLWQCMGPTERFRKTYTKGNKTWNNPTHNQWQVKTLEDIIKQSGYTPKPRQRFCIPIVEELKYIGRELPIDAYLVGVLLGDGSTTQHCCIHSNDIEIINSITLPSDCEWGTIYHKPNTTCKSYSIKGLKPYLEEIGMQYTNCYNKIIPIDYLHSNVRLAVLQGLMDTDGYTDGHRHEFVSVSEQLAKDVVQLCYSLGIKCSLTEKKTIWKYKGTRKESKAWRVSIWSTSVPLFRLTRKKDKQILDAQKKNGEYRILVSIEKVRQEQARCIALTDEEHLFITNDYVVTHNSELGAFELTCHATGNYPPWWEGKRFTRPIQAWVGGDTSITVRDILQRKLLGDIGDLGSGMLRKDDIVETKTRRNLPDAIETIRVRHRSGGVSTIVLKTYEQGREVWQGTEQDIIWLDEEPPVDIYSEALIRTMTTNGIVMLTFTPLRGLSQVVLSFMENDHQAKDSASKYTVIATWDDVPHLSQQAKDELLQTIPINERKARSEGIPRIGYGMIYPVDLDEVITKDIAVPKFWPKAFALDVGWNRTAALWGALNRETDTLYIYSEHYAGEQEPLLHAKAIKARGAWIRGVVDPAARGRSQVDGQRLFDIYALSEERGGCGLKLGLAENAVESGIYEVWQRFQTGRLKIFKSCPNLIKELSLYHRNEKGDIVKRDDHLVDCLRYLIVSGLKVASCQIEQIGMKKDIKVDYAAWC